MTCMHKMEECGSTSCTPFLLDMSPKSKLTTVLLRHDKKSHLCLSKQLCTSQGFLSPSRLSKNVCFIGVAALGLAETIFGLFDVVLGVAQPWGGIELEQGKNLMNSGGSKSECVPILDGQLCLF